MLVHARGEGSAVSKAKTLGTELYDVSTVSPLAVRERLPLALHSSILKLGVHVLSVHAFSAAAVSGTALT